MLESILTIIGAWSFKEIMIFIVVIYALYMIYLKLTHTDYCDTVFEIKSKYKKSLRNYIRDSLTSVHTHTLERARHIMRGVKPPECNKVCAYDIKDAEVAAFDLRLETILRGYITDYVFIAIFNNGFNKLSEIELNEYIKTKAILIHGIIHEKMVQYEHQYPNIINSDNPRFTEEQAIKVYGDIIKKYLRLKMLEKLELKELKDKYTLWHWVKKWIPFTKMDK